MDYFLYDSDSKIISFPVEEYKNALQKEPEGFEPVNIAAHALGCFCFCIAVSEIFKNIPIKPSFKHPECRFIYKLSDFEKKYIKSLSPTKKNRLFSLKGKIYDINFENKNISEGKTFIKFYSFDENTLELSIKFEFKKACFFLEREKDTEFLKTAALQNMELLFKSVGTKFFPELNKDLKPYTQKTIGHVPEYLKFATASFIQEFRKLMTCEKNKICVGEDNILAEKMTNAGNCVFKHDFKTTENAEITHRIEKMNDLTVDVLNGIIHLISEKSETPDLKILFSIDDLLFIRGKKAGRNQKGVRGGYKDSQRKEITEQLELLAGFKLNISKTFMPVIDEKGKRKYDLYQGESPLIYVRKAEDKDYYYVKPGEALALTLRGAGTKTGLIHKKIAEYDYYRNFWEKRLGNYLAWIWRTGQNKADFLVPSGVGTLINQIGEENKLKRPRSIRNRLENALDRLENDGVIKSWQYKSIDESILTGKNWFQTWLNHKLIIEPPIEILEEYSKIKKIKIKKEPKKFNFREILKIIKEKKLSQLKIAEELRIPPEILAGILTGKTLPTAYEKRKIQRRFTAQEV